MMLSLNALYSLDNKTSYESFTKEKVFYTDRMLPNCFFQIFGLPN